MFSGCPYVTMLHTTYFAGYPRYPGSLASVPWKPGIGIPGAWHRYPWSSTTCTTTCTTDAKTYIKFNYFKTSLSSSSSPSLMFAWVSILKAQLLSSPHVLAQHGLSHDILQCDEIENCLVIIVKLGSGNPVLFVVA